MHHFDAEDNAWKELTEQLQQPDVVVLGLGDSPNDLPMLEAVDQAVVVPGAQGPHPVFQVATTSGRFQLAQETPHPTRMVKVGHQL